ncbi:MAG: hypothetical protein FWH32_00150 [Clostridiales bacterium]|nr:hypothetical protein [Clostridiales bacterium]
MLRKKKKLSSDLFYTMMAGIVVAAVLQIVVYPVIAKYYGVSAVGDILFFMGFIYIIPQAVGTSILNTRLILRKTIDATNADYWPIMTVCTALSAVICFAIGFFNTGNMVFSICFGLFSILQVLKVYGAVEFRLNLDFKGTFTYNLLGACGYLVGLGVFFLTEKWLLIFVIGDSLSLLYVFIRGSIYRKAEKTENASAVPKTALPLLWSSLVRDGVVHFDKVIVRQIMDAQSVTQYHAISLVAKTMHFLVAPIRVLLMSYMTQRNWKMTKGVYKKITLACAGFGVAGYGFSILVAPLYVYVFYNELYSQVIQYNLIVNLGLVMGFVASLHMAVLMSQGETGKLSLIQTFWGVGFLIASYASTYYYGLWGIAWTTVIANGAKLVAAIIASYRAIDKGGAK